MSRNDVKGKIDCLIFDCDGVLVDSEPIGIGVFIDLANELGADIDYDFGVKHFQGNSMSEVLKIIQSRVEQPLPDDFVARYRKISFERFSEELKPIAGVLELIPQLKLPFCVASSGPVSKIRHNLAIIGLLSSFEERIFSCYELEKWKPDPTIYFHAAATMGFEPSRCLVVEDSLLGVQAGVASGCNVYAYAEHAQNEEALVNAGATLFYNMLDLLKLVN